jgi:hypothetical protein
MSNTLQEMAEAIAQHEASLNPPRPTSAVAGNPTHVISGALVKFCNVYRPIRQLVADRSRWSVSVLDDPLAPNLIPSTLRGIMSSSRQIAGTDDRVVNFSSGGQIAVVPMAGQTLDLGEMNRYAADHNLSMDTAIINTRVDIAVEVIERPPSLIPGFGGKARLTVPTNIALPRVIRIDLEAVMKNLDERLNGAW